jgi:hypothetical protein
MVPADQASIGASWLFTTAAHGAKPKHVSIPLRVRFLGTSGLTGEKVNEDSLGARLAARTSTEFSDCLGRGDTPERMEVGACSSLPAISDEIVRTDIN